MSENPQNPYVGPRAFQLGETLYGRDRETRDLLNMLIAERIVLLYSPSGAGKTSLVNAALVPRLISKDFQVRPPIRVNVDPPAELLAGPNPINRFVLSMMMSLEEGLPSERRIAPQELALLSLEKYLHDYRSRHDLNITPTVSSETPDPNLNHPVTDEVLLLDQFEEIFTTDPVNAADRVEFFVQLGEALLDRRRWALLVMREDFIAMLDPFVANLPTRLQNTFRLDLLDHGAAHAAMQQPARQANILFTNEAANKLANDLSLVYVRGPNGERVSKIGQYIEPVQLQVVCYRLWRPGIDTIGAEDVASIGNVDEVLADYYDDCVTRSAQAGDVRERAIRDWFDRELITQNIRGRVMAGSKQCKQLTAGAIQCLIDDHLIRAEELRGEMWYELAHDRLIEPVQNSNAKWREKHLSPVQRQAEWWEQQHRSDDLLMHGATLSGAEQWAKVHETELTDVERDFLDACRKARIAEHRERRNNRWVRGLAVAALIGLVLALIGSGAAISEASRAETEAHKAVAAKTEAEQQRNQAKAAEAEADQRRIQAENAETEAKRQARVALSRQLAGQAIANLEAKPDLALLLSLEALNITDTAEARNSLLTALQASHYVSATLHGQRFSVSDMVVSLDGKTLAVAGKDEIILWDIHTGQPIGSPLVLNNEWISSLAFNQNGRTLTLAAGGCSKLDSESNCVQGDVQLWDVSEPRVPVRLSAPIRDHTDTVWSVAFSPDGKTLASGSRDRTIRLWNVSTPQAPLPEGVPLVHPDWVSSVAFGPDGNILASNGCKYSNPTSGLCKVVLWNVANRQKPISTTLTGDIDRVMKVAFSPKGARLAAAGNNGAIILWDAQTGDQLRPALKSEGSFIQSIAFSPDGSRLATSSKNEGITLWDLSAEPPYKSESLASGNFGSMIFVSDSILASGNADDGVVTIWNKDMKESPALLVATADFGKAITITTVAVAENIKQMAFGTDNGYVSHLDLGSNDVWADSMRDAKVTSLAFSNDTSMLAAGDANGTIKIWDKLKSKNVLAEVNEHTDAVVSLAFSPHDDRIVSGGDSRVIVWDISDQQSIRKTGVYTYPGESTVTSSIFYSGGTRLAVGSAEGSIVLLKILPPGNLSPVGLPLTSKYRSPVKSLAFSPNGNWLASGHEDGNITLWDVAEDPPIGHPLLGQKEDKVSDLAFSPDSSLLVAGGCRSNDRADTCQLGSIRLWDVDSRQSIGQSFNLHAKPVDAIKLRSVSPSPEEVKWVLFTAGEDNQLGFWNLTLSDWKKRACQVAGRNLSRDEWEQYLPHKEYHAVCPEAPVYLYEIVEQADAYALAGNTPETAPMAKETYDKALQVALQTESASLNNSVCWNGSIDGFAQLVLPACERAVQLAPEDGTANTSKSWYRDSRGLAYATTGDYKHAIEDFKAFIHWTETHEGWSIAALKRNAWIEALEQCVNEPNNCVTPFSDPRTLRSLKND